MRILIKRMKLSEKAKKNYYNRKEILPKGIKPRRKP